MHCVGKYRLQVMKCFKRIKIPTIVCGCMPVGQDGLQTRLHYSRLHFRICWHKNLKKLIMLLSKLKAEMPRKMSAFEVPAQHRCQMYNICTIHVILCSVTCI